MASVTFYYHVLSFTAASFAENFYDLKRVGLGCSGRLPGRLQWTSLICLASEILGVFMFVKTSTRIVNMHNTSIRLYTVDILTINLNVRSLHRT